MVRMLRALAATSLLCTPVLGAALDAPAAQAAVPALRLAPVSVSSHYAPRVHLALAPAWHHGVGGAPKPIAYEGRSVFDQAGLLSDPAAVESQFTGSGEGPKLVLALMDSTQGDIDSAAHSWAKRTGQPQDAVIFFASMSPRRYVVLAGPDTGISKSQLNDLDKMFKKRLSSAIKGADWDAQMTKLAQDTHQQLQGDFNSGSSGTQIINKAEDSDTPSMIIGLILLASPFIVIGMVTWMIVRAVKRRRQEQTAYAQQGGQIAPSIPKNLGAMPLPQLSQLVSETLLNVDNGLRDAREELEFARAQFGINQTDQFAQLIDSGQRKLDRSWSLFNEANSTPNEQHKVQLFRTILTEIGDLDQQLAQHQQIFTQLRTTTGELPSQIPQMRGRVAELDTWIQSAQTNVANLRASFPSTDLASLEEIPDRIAQLRDAANQVLDSATDQLSHHQPTQALQGLQIAQRLVTQAQGLLQQTDQAFDKLSQATDLLFKAITAASESVRDAHKLAPNDETVRRYQGTLNQHIELASAARKGQGDPLRALDALASAQRDLNYVLQPYRDQEENRKTASEAVLSRAEGVSAAVERAATFININRGAVGADARALLETARNELQQAKQIATTNPTQADTLLADASKAVEQSLQIADQEVQRARNQSGNSVPRSVTDWLGGMNTPSNGGFLTGLILGGILNGGSRHSWGSSTPSWGDGWDTSSGGLFGDSGGGFSGGGFSGGFSSSGGGSF